MIEIGHRPSPTSDRSDSNTYDLWRQSAFPSTAWWRHEMPWIQERHAGRFKVGRVAGDHGHPVNQRRSGNQGVSIRSWVGYMQSSALARHILIHWKNPT
jgi:hypothetical protein